MKSEKFDEIASELSKTKLKTIEIAAIMAALYFTDELITDPTPTVNVNRKNFITDYGTKCAGVFDN